MDFVIWTTVVSVGLSIIFVTLSVRAVLYRIRQEKIRSLRSDPETVRRAVQQVDHAALKDATKRIAANLESGNYRRVKLLPSGKE